MKNFRFIGMALLCLFLITSCNKNDLSESECEPKSVDTYAQLGEWHNDFLTNINDNFEPDYSSELTYEQKIEIIKKFNQAHIGKLKMSSADQEQLYAEFENFKYLVDKRVTYEKLFVETDITPGQDIYGEVKMMQRKGIIDDFEQELVFSTLDLVKSNYDGEIGAEDLKKELMALREDWTAHGYTDCDKTGEFSAMVLSIGLSSVDWWIANPEAGEGGSLRAVVAPWIAADVGGAIYGATAGAVGSYLLNGEVNWQATGWAALAGAVGASTGIAGKIGSWLFG